jgi:hypothetical protein
MTPMRPRRLTTFSSHSYVQTGRVGRFAAGERCGVVVERRFVYGLRRDDEQLPLREHELRGGEVPQCEGCPGVAPQARRRAVPVPSELRLGRPASLPRCGGCGSSSCVQDHAHSSSILRGSGDRRRTSTRCRWSPDCWEAPTCRHPSDSSTCCAAVWTRRATTPASRPTSSVNSTRTTRVDRTTPPHCDPCCLVVSLEFSGEQNALLFEQYLKTGSGRAFARRHFL